MTGSGLVVYSCDGSAMPPAVLFEAVCLFAAERLQHTVRFPVSTCRGLAFIVSLLLSRLYDLWWWLDMLGRQHSASSACMCLPWHLWMT